MSPIVSIIIPTHNRGTLLMQTIASVQAQTLADFEAIVVDDHSTDDTLKLIAPVELSDPRFKHISLLEGKSGAQAARNAGIKAAGGKYLILLDSDDLLAPNCLQNRAAFMDGNPELDFAVYECEVFRNVPGDAGTRWNIFTDENDLDRFLKWDVTWQTTSPIWKTQSIRNVGEWDESVAVAQDWHFHIMALAKGLKYQKVNQIDHYWRRPDGTRESIGSDAHKPALVRSRAETTRKVYELLKSTNQLTEPRKKLMASLFYQAAEKIAERVSRKEARHYWDAAIETGVVASELASLGKKQLYNYRFVSMRQKYRKQIQDWFGDLYLGRSRTSLVCPVGDKPTISCVMPAYNAEKYLASAIDSVLRQTWRDFELIVVDDGSTDRTLEILRDYEKRDARVRILSRPNTGHTGAINDGIDIARSELIARMDGDDLCLPTRFEKQLAFMREHPEVVLLGTNVELIDPHDISIGTETAKTIHDEIDAQLMRGTGGVIRHPTAMFRKWAYDKVGPYHKEFNGSEDLDLWLRMSEIGQVANLPDVLLKYRRHYESFSFVKNETQMNHKKLILGEACQRRGLPPPVVDLTKFWRPPPIDEQMKQWGWKALKIGRIDAARDYAKSLIKKKPFSPDSWRLMFCALRGR